MLNYSTALWLVSDHRVRYIMSWNRVAQSLKRICSVHTLVSSILVVGFCAFTYVQYTGADQTVINTIRNDYLFPPSSESYSLQNPEESDPSMGQSVAVLHILGLQRGGFFVDHEARDGETHSNTIFMERNLHWQGVLIESDPKNFELLLQKQRRSWSINACLGDLTQTLISTASLEPPQAINNSRANSIRKVTDETGLLIDCFPLHLILLALNQTVVDYLSLDLVEHNLGVVDSIPHGLINVRTMSIRLGANDEEKSAGLRNYLKSNGYSVHQIISNINETVSDFIVMKTSEFPHVQRLNDSVTQSALQPSVEYR